MPAPERAHLSLPCLLLWASLCVAGPVAANCVDESRLESSHEPVDATVTPADPRIVLRGLVQTALERSRPVGAAQLLAEAAADDVDNASSATGVRAEWISGLGPSGSQNRSDAGSSQVDTTSRWSNTLGVSQLLWDGGRTASLVSWRTQLAESARLGHLSAREQLALTTVALALERARFRQHVVVYGQYARKSACLVEALETIVRADRGRASELVQARKSAQQSELAQAQAQSAVRALEVRLRRLVGDNLPPSHGLSSLLLEVGELQHLVADVERSADIGALTAQQAAAAAFADSVAASGRPSLRWSASGTRSDSRVANMGSVRDSSWQIGLQLTTPLLEPGHRSATDAARRRAQASELQRAEALEQRRFRVAELHEQTLSAFDRARRLGSVLRDSDQLRNFTLQQWQQLGRRSLFDVMAAEAEHYNLRIAHVNAMADGQQLNANMLALGRGVQEWLR